MMDKGFKKMNASPADLEQQLYNINRSAEKYTVADFDQVIGQLLNCGAVSLDEIAYDMRSMMLIFADESEQSEYTSRASARRQVSIIFEKTKVLTKYGLGNHIALSILTDVEDIPGHEARALMKDPVGLFSKLSYSIDRLCHDSTRTFFIDAITLGIICDTPLSVIEKVNKTHNCLNALYALTGRKELLEIMDGPQKKHAVSEDFGL
jgi:hypothetical protein